jgi:hypothetical protein
VRQSAHKIRSEFSSTTNKTFCSPTSVLGLKAVLPRGVGQSSFRPFSQGCIVQATPRNLVTELYARHFYSHLHAFLGRGSFCAFFLLCRPSALMKKSPGALVKNSPLTMLGIQFGNQICSVTMSHHVYFCKKTMLYLSPMVSSRCSLRIATANRALSARLQTPNFPSESAQATALSAIWGQFRTI